ncbi:hypothetical protein C8Q79DRAFT_219229 [Trametes meyenii]|nr:hypothetical protein C8Q79DRAFT_219229 [Trametes meyenii]
MLTKFTTLLAIAAVALGSPVPQSDPLEPILSLLGDLPIIGTIIDSLPIATPAPSGIAALPGEIESILSPANACVSRPDAHQESRHRWPPQLPATPQRGSRWCPRCLASPWRPGPNPPVFYPCAVVECAAHFAAAQYNIR